ncbi:MAG: hypothetical protein ABSG62_12700 [Terracidiphilus sp.]
MQLQLQLLKHLECLLSGDMLGSNPAADARRLQVPKAASSNLGENHIRKTLTNRDFDGTPAVQPFILYKLKYRTVRVRDHDPFGFAKMRRHLLISAIR